MQAAAEAQRPVTPALLGVVLGFELFAVLFVALALIGSRTLPVAEALLLAAVLALLNVVALITVRTAWGIWCAVALQIALLASSIVQPAIAIVAVVFIGLWGAALWRGTRADHRAASSTWKEEDPHAGD